MAERFTLNQWMDTLEGSLHAQAEIAGLLAHGTMIGSSREFFIRRVLRSMLPSSVHVGSGRVVTFMDGRMSKQVDIVLYDPRCPLLEVDEGSGLYFAEGVLATIEVKSELTKTTLLDALDNCRSVMDSDLLFSPADAQRRAELLISTGLTPTVAQERIKWALTPRTYIFAFRNSMSTQLIADTIDEWRKSGGDFPSAQRAYLPRIIAAPGVLALQNDGWMNFDAGADVIAQMRTENPNAEPVMGVWPSERHFGWFCVHLLHSVYSVLGHYSFEESIRFGLDHHLGKAAEEIFARHMNGKPAWFLSWPP